MGSHPELGHQLPEKYQLQVRAGAGWGRAGAARVLGQDAHSNQVCSELRALLPVLLLGV